MTDIVRVPVVTTKVVGVARGPMGLPGRDASEEQIAEAVEAYLEDNPVPPADHTHEIADVDGLQGELDEKAPLVSPAFTGTPTGITKAHVGLGNVDNTSDVNKPVSDATAVALAGKAGVAHTHTSAGITDFPEAVQDVVAGFLAAGANVTLVHDDAGNILTVSATGGGGGDAEMIRDTIGAAVLGLGLISVLIDDAADTITIVTTATQNSTDAALRDRSTHTGTQLAETISDFATAADARVAAGITGKKDAVEVRHSNDGTYDYTGTAPVGTAEGSSGWDVTRVTIASPPVVKTGTGTWTGRASISYS